MEAICNNCNHWEQKPEQVKIESDAFGVCDELSGKTGMNPEYVLPLVHDAVMENNTPQQFEMITGAQFGCNHFSERRSWI
ncbi:hypothetical protein [Pontibacter sp. SGAir0037]|uniref:hypothetical protein n=1 Tax=Pontibacter sp. SGAir0037 TaxID=2571030 RepID=UPI0010CD0EC9|nr:hypothetical protein [Pontibacter sp. SGAir0037]QCR22573.1 hypothetical protein C1N53_09645 [Pontibacter sp. SGAir0037]